MRKFAVLLSLVLVLAAGTASAQENINSYQAEITVNADSSIMVLEKIQYDFGQEQRHGIFRDIPVRYERSGYNYNLRISDVLVVDELNQPYKFEASTSGGVYKLKIGDPDLIVSGSTTYSISYKVERAINYFKNNDELYWNVIGGGWGVPISQASARVILPTDGGNIQTGCFYGPTGYTSTCSASVTQKSIDFTLPSLNAGENFTIVVAFEKGVVQKPGIATNLINILRDNLIFGLPILTLIVMLFVWNRYGRDPKPSIPITAQYEAPDGLTPVEAGFIMDEENQNREIVAQIIYLATKGYLKIERIPKQGWFGKDDYKVTKLKEENDLPDQFDKNLMRTLFVLGPNEILLSTLRKKGKVTRSNFSLFQVSKKLFEQGYYKKDPSKVKHWFITAPVGIAFLLAFSLNFFNVSTLIAVIISFGVFVLFGWFMPQKTQKGVDAKQLLLGLKEYISVAEKDRLDFHNDPEKDPKIFEKLLPYAIVFGVTDKWAKKFEGLFDYNPSWYVDPASHGFNSIIFASSINSFNRGFETMVTASSKSAGSGGSGLGGGGFSGGGFGGGGGGSW